jgi:hypothetical protein
MSYLDAVAAQISAEVPNDALPPEDAESLFLMYAVLLLAKGTDVTNEDVHNAWTAWMESNGRLHKSMVPFSALPAETKLEDSVFCQAIRRVAHRLNEQD